MGGGGVGGICPPIYLIQGQIFCKFSELDSFLKWTNNSVIHIKKKKKNY